MWEAEERTSTIISFRVRRQILRWFSADVYTCGGYECTVCISIYETFSRQGEHPCAPLGQASARNAKEQCLFCRVITLRMGWHNAKFNRRNRSSSPRRRTLKYCIVHSSERGAAESPWYNIQRRAYSYFTWRLYGHNKNVNVNRDSYLPSWSLFRRSM